MKKVSDSAELREVVAEVPGITDNGDAPVFDQPWQAQVFAMALSLHKKGFFTWREWAQTLGDEISKARAAGDSDDGSTYYNHWIATLERLVEKQGLVTRETLDSYARAWGRAADRTPHGAPITLHPTDFD
ncbi:MAG: nitrile hydratase accessory protein [Hyphomicrobiaceae bacterium]